MLPDVAQELTERPYRQLLDLKATRDARRSEIIQRVEEGSQEELSELAPRDMPDEDVRFDMPDSE